MKLKTALIGLGIAFIGGAAIAGFVQPAPVLVDTTAMLAQGDQVSARYSKNDVEFIGCGMRKVATGPDTATFNFGFCQATDAAGVGILCTTANPELLDAIASSADFGFITFSWNADLECTRIGFSNQSFYLPQGLKAN
jgi:hypothetical protein